MWPVQVGRSRVEAGLIRADGQESGRPEPGLEDLVGAARNERQVGGMRSHLGEQSEVSGSGFHGRSVSRLLTGS